MGGGRERDIKRGRGRKEERKRESEAARERGREFLCRLALC